MERCFPVWSQVNGENESHGPPLHCFMAFLFLAEPLCSMYDRHLKPDGRPALFLLYWDLPDQLWTCGESIECFGAVLGDVLCSLDSWEFRTRISPHERYVCASKFAEMFVCLPVSHSHLGLYISLLKYISAHVRCEPWVSSLHRTCNHICWWIIDILRLKNMTVGVTQSWVWIQDLSLASCDWGLPNLS